MFYRSKMSTTSLIPKKYQNQNQAVMHLTAREKWRVYSFLTDERTANYTYVHQVVTIRFTGSGTQK